MSKANEQGRNGQSDAARAAELSAGGPHNLDAERALLGSMLIDPDIIDKVVTKVRAEDFYHNPHQILFRTICDLHAEAKPIEPTLLADTLRREGNLDAAGGIVYIAGLEQFVLSTSAAPDHAEMVREKSALRALMAAGRTIAGNAEQQSHDAIRQIRMAEALLYEISEQHHVSEFVSVRRLMEETLKEIGEIYHSREVRHGQKTHLRELDEIIGGLEPTALAILAARPSIGKTALALNMVRNIAVMEGRPVGFFSLEMGAEQLNLRLLCGEAQVPGHLVQRAKFNEQHFTKLRETATRMMDVPIFIDDTPGLTLMDLRSRARQLKKGNPDLALIVVDYLQLMQGPPGRRSDSRQQEVAEISRGLKMLAKELHTPVLALSQLSRNIEQRSGREKSARPMLSDLRESGSIEQDADVVMFVHRERIETQKEDGEEKRGPGPLAIPTDIIVGKNRNGPIGTAEMLFIPDWTKFVSPAIGYGG